MNEIKKGWGWPINSRKAHYFTEDKRSLCGKWAYFGELDDCNDDSPDNCTACKKALQKRKAMEVMKKLEEGEKIEF